jgi:hypothetical protein
MRTYPGRSVKWAIALAVLGLIIGNPNWFPKAVTRQGAVVMMLLGALAVTFAGWFGREMARLGDCPPEERESEERRGVMSSRIVGAIVILYGAWRLISG